MIYFQVQVCTMKKQLTWPAHVTVWPHRVVLARAKACDGVACAANLGAVNVACARLASHTGLQERKGKFKRKQKQPAVQNTSEQEVCHILFK